jgi:hypothetical protein
MRHGPPKVHILHVVFAVITATASGHCSGPDCTFPLDDEVSLLQVSTFENQGIKRRAGREKSEASLAYDAWVESMEERTEADKQQTSVLSEAVMEAVIPGMFSVMVLLFAGISGLIGIVLCANLRFFPHHRKGTAPPVHPESPKLSPQVIAPPPEIEEVPEVPVVQEDEDRVVELCEGGGFLVKKGEVYKLMVPALPAKPDTLYDFNIATAAGVVMSVGQYVDVKGDPFNGRRKEAYDEYITMTSPPGHEEGREYSTMFVGKPPNGSSEAHIIHGPSYAAAGSGFAIVRKSNNPKMQYEAVGKQNFYISTNDGETGNRCIRIFSEKIKERASATCYVTGQGRAWYDVHCFENCDMLYVSLAIMAVDRISVEELKKVDHSSWK